jgi:hypothetical protein
VIVDNGKQRRLIIAGLFDGIAGEQNGVLAFIPNLKGKRASEVRRGVLDEQPVHLMLKRSPTAADRFALFTYRRIEA